jgi:hypothetical protein
MSAPPPARPGRRRVDHGTIRFSERDGELLSFIGEQYAVTVPQLARLARVNPTTAKALRDRWRRAGWVASLQLLAYGPSFVWLTRNGVRVAQLPYRALVPNPGLAAHTAAVADVRLLLERELALGNWECERALARETWARRERPHLPDAVLETPGGRIAIEVELTTKGAARLDLILTELADRYPEVWYFAPARVVPTLERAAAATPWRRIRIHPFPPAPADLGR